MGGLLSCEDVKAVLVETIDEAEAEKVLHNIAEDIVAKGVGAAIRENAPEVAKLAGVVTTELSEKVLERIEKHIEAKGACGSVEEIATAVGEAVSSVSRDIVLERDVSTDAEHSPCTGEHPESPSTEAATEAERAVSAEEVADTARDAAAEAESPVVAVEFVGEKGALQRVDFMSRELGFELATAGGGCLSAKGQRKIVAKFGKGGLAQTLGIKSKLTVASIDGVEVTGLEQARRLLAESVAKLPEA